MSRIPSLEDQMLQCGQAITAARNRGDIPALAVLEPMMDAYLDQWLMFYPAPTFTYVED